MCAAVEAGCRALGSSEIVGHAAAAAEHGDVWRGVLRAKNPAVDRRVSGALSVQGQGLLTILKMDEEVERDLAGRVVTRMLEHGVLVASERNVVILAPPLCVTKGQLKTAALVVRRSLESVLGVGKRKKRKGRVKPKPAAEVDKNFEGGEGEGRKNLAPPPVDAKARKPKRKVERKMKVKPGLRMGSEGEPVPEEKTPQRQETVM